MFDKNLSTHQNSPVIHKFIRWPADRSLLFTLEEIKYSESVLLFCWGTTGTGEIDRSRIIQQPWIYGYTLHISSKRSKYDLISVLQKEHFPSIKSAHDTVIENLSKQHQQTHQGCALEAISHLRKKCNLTPLALDPFLSCGFSSLMWSFPSSLPAPKTILKQKIACYNTTDFE